MRRGRDHLKPQSRKTKGELLKKKHAKRRGQANLTSSKIVFTYYANCRTPLRPYLINRIDLRVRKEIQFGDLVFSTASLLPLYFSI